MNYREEGVPSPEGEPRQPAIWLQPSAAARDVIKRHARKDGLFIEPEDVLLWNGNSGDFELLILLFELANRRLVWKINFPRIIGIVPSLQFSIRYDRTKTEQPEPASSILLNRTKLARRKRYQKARTMLLLEVNDMFRSIEKPTLPPYPPRDQMPQFDIQ